MSGALRIEGCALVGDVLVDDAVILVRDGRLSFVGPADRAPATAADEASLHHRQGIVSPAYVDLHVHGAGGADAADGTDEALAVLCRAHALRGTGALCPTVLTSPPPVLLRALETIRRATGRRPGDGARVLGAHLEGPFLSPARAGAQPPGALRTPDRALVEELLAAAGGTLRIVTLAPELPGALELVELLVDRGVVVSLGHTDATWDQALAAVEVGARLAAHTFNAMRPLHHREAGVLGAVLCDERVTTEVIADGIHVSGPALQLLWRLKGAERVALVTDCTAALDAPPGGARLGDQPVEVRDGAVRLADGTLAGSSLTMERAVSVLVRLAGAPVARALRAASSVPAAVLGLDGGTLEPGKRADLLLLSPNLAPQRVLVGGEWLDRR